MDREDDDDEWEDDDDDFDECGKPVYRGDELVGTCIRWFGHVGPCANIILLR